jgi:hypothetical protein
MDPISHIDPLLALLRQRLAERTRSTTRTAKVNVGKGHGPAVAPTTGHGEPDERQMRRALVQQVLVDQLGADLINDAQFQGVVARVADAMESDTDTANMLQKLVNQLKPRP